MPREVPKDKVTVRGEFTGWSMAGNGWRVAVPLKRWRKSGQDEPSAMLW
jgi:hypothetical protein